MPAAVGFRGLPKRRLVLLVPESVDATIRDAAHRTRKSRSEVGAVALAAAFGIDLAAAGRDDAPVTR